ncbi:hypothetical protein NMY22_g10222 [Coprinellus aureogranulatus]|nr:hypothetical protein NMY22_g10222 [Coprinellus aureogranulatus]
MSANNVRPSPQEAMTVLLDERIAAMDRILDSRRGELDRLVRRALETLPPITLDGAPPADVTPQLLELVCALVTP